LTGGWTSIATGMLLTLLGAILWSQPQTRPIFRNHTCNLLLQATEQLLDQVTSEIMRLVVDMCWTIWIRTVQMMIVVINGLFCGKTKTRRRRHSKDIWHYVVAGIDNLMAAIGDFIVRNTLATSHCHRRATTAINRHQRAAKLVELSVLAMQASATIATERDVRFDTDSHDIARHRRSMLGMYFTRGVGF
jgi:hypothetical protein